MMRILILILICASVRAEAGIIGDTVHRITGHVGKTLGIAGSENEEPVDKGTNTQEETSGSPSLPFKFFKGIFNNLDRFIDKVVGSEDDKIGYEQGVGSNEQNMDHNQLRIPRRIYRYYENMGVTPLPNSEMCSCPFDFQFQQGWNNNGRKNNRKNSFIGELDEGNIPFAKPPGKRYPSLDNSKDFGEEAFNVPNDRDILNSGLHPSLDNSKDFSEGPFHVPNDRDILKSGKNPSLDNSKDFIEELFHVPNDPDILKSGKNPPLDNSKNFDEEPFNVPNDRDVLNSGKHSVLHNSKDFGEELFHVPNGPDILKSGKNPPSDNSKNFGEEPFNVPNDRDILNSGKHPVLDNSKDFGEELFHGPNGRDIMKSGKNPSLDNSKDFGEEPFIVSNDRNILKSGKHPPLDNSKDFGEESFHDSNDREILKRPLHSEDLSGLKQEPVLLTSKLSSKKVEVEEIQP